MRRTTNTWRDYETTENVLGTPGTAARFFSGPGMNNVDMALLAAMPMNTVDPIVLAARIVLALQTVVSRENNPTDPVVITVDSIHSGTPGNISFRG